MKNRFLLDCSPGLVYLHADCTITRQHHQKALTDDLLFSGISDMYTLHLQVHTHRRSPAVMTCILSHRTSGPSTTIVIKSRRDSLARWYVLPPYRQICVVAKARGNRHSIWWSRASHGLPFRDLDLLLIFSLRRNDRKANTLSIIGALSATCTKFLECCCEIASAE